MSTICGDYTLEGCIRPVIYLASNKGSWVPVTEFPLTCFGDFHGLSPANQKLFLWIQVPTRGRSSQK